jgi:hypothetical protein
MYVDVNVVKCVVVIYSASIPSSSKIVLVFGTSGADIVVEIVKVESHIVDTDTMDFAKVTGFLFVLFVIGIGFLFEKSLSKVELRGGH